MTSVGMSDPAVAVTTEAALTKPATPRPGLLFLVIALGLVLACRVLLYVWMPDRGSDFDLLYDAAARLFQGGNPYSPAAQGLPYPLPAVILAVPFSWISLPLARPIFDIMVGWAFVYALWRYRGSYALLAAVSGAYLYAIWSGQTTPLMVAAALVPALGFLLAVRPNTSASLWIAWPSLRALFGASLFLVLSLVALPSWPVDWWTALLQDNTQLVPPVLRPFGVVLLLAALRWRTPEGRLLLAIAFIPQSTLPYELVALALIPATGVEMGIYVVGSWIAVAAWLQLSPSMVEWTATGWPLTLCAVYLPMLYLVVRRQSNTSGQLVVKERRRANRLSDHELQVDVTTDGEGGVVVKVTHLPSAVSATESAETRHLASRKAHDKLAGILAPMLRLRRKS
jgi:hypothetical protein